jgi:YcaO-like protein with predicted kinase domain
MRARPESGSSEEDARGEEFAEAAGRACAPAETLRRYRHLRAPAGLTRIADVTGLDVIGIPVSLGIRPTARSLVISVGKGLHRDTARAGALMEGLECWYAENVEPGLCQMTFADLADSALDPATLPTALDWDPNENLFSRCCDWVRGTRANSGEPVWVPFDVVSLDYRCARLSRPWLARSSNGLASGNTWQEAALHGVCEVIERDAEWRWRRSEDSGRLQLGTIDDDACSEILGRIRHAGLFVACWDVTGPTRIPSFGCVIMPDPVEGIWGGAGAHDGFACHPSPRQALASALLEAVQKRLTYISGSRDDVTRSEMARATSPELATRVWEDCLHEPETVSFRGGLAADDPPDATAYLQFVFDALDRAGFPPPVVVNICSSEYDGPAVVKAIVPGMYGPYGSSNSPLKRAGDPATT